MLEPVGRNTAPAVAAAALTLVADDPGAVMLVLPSDHVIPDEAAFLSCVDAAVAAAGAGALVTFGVAPSRPETGYGYIRAGAALSDGPCRRVDAFVEKPDQATAESYVADDRYYWNSGMFVFTAARYLDELERHRPDMVAGCRAAVDGSVVDLDFRRLEEASFSAIAADSIDYAVMEKTDAAAMVPAEFGWSDLGSWSAMWDIEAKDGDGNVLIGGRHHRRRAKLLRPRRRQAGDRARRRQFGHRRDRGRRVRRGTRPVAGRQVAGAETEGRQSGRNGQSTPPSTGPGAATRRSIPATGSR